MSKKTNKGNNSSKSDQSEKKKDSIELEGVVVKALGEATFEVDCGNDHTVIAYISGKIRKNYIKILPGDKVRVAVSLYDLTKGRIVYRMK